MAAVEIRPESYKALQALAESKGASIEMLLEMAVEDLLRRQDTNPNDWLRRWHALQAEIQTNMPPGVTAEEIEADIDAAIAEVRAESRARGR